MIAPRDAGVKRATGAIIFALGALYMAQGIPFGFATEYLPVVMRESGVSYTGIAALSWLQLPWQLKIFWAKAADHPRLQARTRLVIFAMQLALTAVVAAFALCPLREAPILWLALTFVAAALAATQDVFVDAFAVRALRPRDRGFGNTAQVAGYRLGMLVGGAALLLLVGRLGEPTTLLACSGVVAVASFGAVVGTGGTTDRGDEKPPRRGDGSVGMRALVKRVCGPRAWRVVAVALTFKLGLHMASSLLKPMAVDYGWSKQQIGAVVVSVGSASALAGAAAGGLLHRVLGERRALTVSLTIQSLAVAPLVAVAAMHAPVGLTTIVIALEHFASGAGTTVLFAALMTATRPADAGLHYTVLTSANALAIGIGGLMGGICADLGGKPLTFAIAAVVCLLPGALLTRWDEAARASSTEEASTTARTISSTRIG